MNKRNDGHNITICCTFVHDGISVQRPSNSMTKSAFIFKRKTIFRTEKIRTLHNEKKYRLLTACIWCYRWKNKPHQRFFSFSRPACKLTEPVKWFVTVIGDNDIIYFYLTNWTRFAYFFRFINRWKHPLNIFFHFIHISKELSISSSQKVTVNTRLKSSSHFARLEKKQ